jgi:hypothetical protein
MLATRRKTYRLILPLLALIATAAPALADDGYLQVIPGTALAWGAVNHIESAAEKVQNLTKVMQIPAPNLLDTVKKGSGLEKGMDEKSAIGFFAVPTKDEKEPAAAAVFVAVSDEKEFLDNFEIVKGDKIKEAKIKSRADSGSSATHCVAILHGYAVMSPISDRAAVEAAVASKKSVAAEMTGFETWLAENDASLVGTAAGIKFAAKQMKDEMKKSEDATTPGTAELVKNIQKLYGSVLEGGPNEVTLALAGIRCDKQGALRVIGRARLAQGGKLSKAIADLPPVNENLLGNVPGGPFVFAGAGIGIPGFMDAYVNLYSELMKSMNAMGMGGDEMSKMMKESLETAKHIQSMSFVWKQGKRSDPIYSNMYGTMKVDNSTQVLDTQEKYAERFNKILKEGKQPAIKAMEAKRLQVAGKPALQMETTMDFSEVPGTEQSRAMFDMMFGVGNKMLVYNVAADEHTIVMGIGVPQERMAAALDVLAQPKKSLAEDANLSATSSMLPEKSQWVMYLSPRGLMQMTTRITTETLKNVPGANGFVLPEFPKSPPIGFAVKAASDELRAEIAIPAPLVEAAGGYVQEMQKVIMQRMMEQNQPPAP